MNTVGIIAEYNPFHAGHAFHVAETRRRLGECAVAAVMSGNFVQRGECAVLDKWTRAKAALKGGVDLVLTHAAAMGYGDGEDYAHRGFETFNRLLDRFKPAYLILGGVLRPGGGGHSGGHRRGFTPVLWQRVRRCGQAPAGGRVSGQSPLSG